MGMDTHEVWSSKTATLLTATDTTAGGDTLQQALRLKFSAESDSSHTGTTIVDIESKVGTGTLYEWVGTLTVTGNSDEDAFNSAGVLGTYRARPTAHGDSTNVVTVRVEW